jgi:hypothetical protein
MAAGQKLHSSDGGCVLTEGDEADARRLMEHLDLQGSGIMSSFLLKTKCLVHHVKRWPGLQIRCLEDIYFCFCCSRNAVKTS